MRCEQNLQLGSVSVNAHSRRRGNSKIAKPRQRPPRPRKPSPKNAVQRIICCSCNHVLSLDDQALAIKCEWGHFICARDLSEDSSLYDRCSSRFVRAQAETNYAPPIKCPMCKCAEVILPTFIRFLDDAQLNIFTTQMASSTLLEGEHLLECPNCSYSEIHDTSRSTENIALLHCKNRGCGMVTCCVCKLGIGKLLWTTFDEGAVSLSRSGPGFEERAEEHLTSCFSLASLRKEFDDAMECAAKFKCPSCKRSGRKDEGCVTLKHSTLL
jgi:hypothetical protein